MALPRARALTAGEAALGVHSDQNRKHTVNQREERFYCLSLPEKNKEKEHRRGLPVMLEPEEQQREEEEEERKETRCGRKKKEEKRKKERQQEEKENKDEEEKSERVVLRGIFRLGKKSHDVLLTRSRLTWTPIIPETPTGEACVLHSGVVLLQDVFAVKEKREEAAGGDTAPAQCLSGTHTHLVQHSEGAADR
ncbi:hypothetical protein LDENG_00220070 [Lucifuga dentata]|nr:hypothetical protein LDENG_00220070 [Lucifuga dentata]